MKEDKENTNFKNKFGFCLLLFLVRSCVLLALNP